jgi:hypothetical protein
LSPLVCVCVWFFLLDCLPWFVFEIYLPQYMCWEIFLKRSI